MEKSKAKAQPKGSKASGSSSKEPDKPLTLSQFCVKQRELLEVERETGREETENLLATLSPLELQRRGISLSKVRTGAMRTGLGGRSLVDFEHTEQGAMLPAHR